MSEAATYETVYVRRRFVARDLINGESRTKLPEYAIWTGMIARCDNPKGKNYRRYGGRGITVCDRWREDFANFYADMGPRPSARHSIDRFPDNDGNYDPGNCRWATPREQVLNRGGGAKKMRWTDSDLNSLRRLYEAFYTVEEMAVALDRSPATIRLRVFKERLHRPGFMTRLVGKHIELRPILAEQGQEAFIAAVNAKIKAGIERKKAEKHRKTQDKAAKIAEVLATSAPRNEKIRALREGGLSLSEIGSLFRISRERARQIEATGFFAVDGHATGSDRKISATSPAARRKKIDRLCRAWNCASREAKLMFLQAAPNAVFTKLTVDVVEASAPAEQEATPTPRGAAA